ncbi:MAG TPA: GGDEF domain-containing protein [Caulobacteraceae bacterium]|nr:GGDEF domain-containing protein [Caulobacteraceae bacterium]
MPDDVEVAVRGPKAYEVARSAISMMEAAGVWPTSLNFELWLHIVADPAGPLAMEIERLLSSGEAITDFVAEGLAQTYLPKARLHEEIRDAGDMLTKELASVARIFQLAQQNHAVYGEHLADASAELKALPEPASLSDLVINLTAATDTVQRQNQELEQRLAESTAEVGRLRDHLVQVRRDATTDALTNLANRKAFDEELERACGEADAGGGPVVLAVLDIDHFKSFNDTWGHQTGDQVIRYVASVIGRVGAPPRFAARYGGEEFAMIFCREPVHGVDRTLKQVLDEIASRRLRRRSSNEDLGTVTVSAGFAERAPGESPAALVDRADAALYESKRNGRNRVSRAEGCAADAA